MLGCHLNADIFTGKTKELGSGLGDSLLNWGEQFWILLSPKPWPSLLRKTQYPIHSKFPPKITNILNSFFKFTLQLSNLTSL